MSKPSEQIEIYGCAYFVILLDYCKTKGILKETFKFKDFLSEDEMYWWGGHRKYCDCPLKYGQLRIAFAYGLKHNLLMEVGCSRKLNLLKLKVEGWL